MKLQRNEKEEYRQKISDTLTKLEYKQMWKYTNRITDKAK